MTKTKKTWKPLSNVELVLLNDLVGRLSCQPNLGLRAHKILDETYELTNDLLDERRIK